MSSKLKTVKFQEYTNKTRRVLSETKAIMSPLYVTGWNQIFVEEGEILI